VQRYPIRATHRKGLTPEHLEEIVREHFEGVARDGTTVRGHFGAIAELKARSEGKDLVVDLTMNSQVPSDTAQETIRRYNLFLQSATGYSAKERAKRARKSATAPDVAE
jgi:hypothetical protein